MQFVIGTVRQDEKEEKEARKAGKVVVEVQIGVLVNVN